MADASSAILFIIGLRRAGIENWVKNAILRVRMSLCLVKRSWKPGFSKKNQKMCFPILVTLLKMRPHYSQSSRENATPLASHKEVPSPRSRSSNPGLCSIGKIFRWVRLSSINEPNRSQSYDWSSIGFDNWTFDWLRPEYWPTANKANYSTNVVTRKIAQDRSVF